MYGALIFGLLGSALAFGSFVALVLQRVRFASWTSTQGVIAGHRVRHTRRNGRTRTMHHPVVRFHAAGREWMHESSLSKSSPERAEGSSVAVLYDPRNPESACIDELVEKHFVPMLVGTIGIVFTLVGIGVLAQALVP
jgi:hypothetical protein